jgi:anion-transporting  ArsA/GET3 family ATPase
VDLNAWLDRTRLVVCVGSGGVGKTTSAAAIGLWGALRGRKVIVLTIDPAKRLANSLGLDQMGGEPTRIDLSGVPDATGELWAMMLDSRGTFDALISAIAPSDEARQRILGNHVYRHMADALAGSQDYMATEKLHDLVASGSYDLVVLDTPPVKNALDFLESPGRVVAFLDERVLGWFIQPASTGWGARLLGGATTIMNRLLGAIFGQEFLDDFQEFLRDFAGLYEGFRTRHTAVLGMLRAPDTAFVTVCAPTSSSVDVAVFFQEELGKRSLPRAGVIVNQVHRCESTADDAQQALGGLAAVHAVGLPERTTPMLLARLGRAHARLRHLVTIEQELVSRVRGVTGRGSFLQQVPRLEGQVYDLAALRRVGQAIFEAPAEEL